MTGDRAARADAALAAGLGLLAFVLRVPGLARGFTADEVANLTPDGAWAAWTDPETGVNPPLLRVVVGWIAGEAAAPWVGRGLALLAGSASAALVAGLVLRASRSRVGAAVAGLLVAVHPVAVINGAEYRAYALVACALLVHLTALDFALDGGGRRWWAAAVVAGVLVPHLHYLGALSLLGAGIACLLTPGSRRGVLAAVPAAVSLVTVAPWLDQVGRRTVPGEPALVVVKKLLATGLTPPHLFANAASKLWKLGSDLPFHWPSWMTLSVLGLVGGMSLCWRWQVQATRLVLGAYLVTVGGIIWVAQWQNVRDPMIELLLVLLASLVGVAVGAAPTRAGPVVAAGLALGWLLPGVVALTPELQMRRRLVDEVGGLAARVEAIDAARAGGDLYVTPAYEVPSLYYHLTGEHFRHAPHEPDCVGPCFRWGDRRVVGIGQVGDGSALRGALVAWLPVLPDGFASRCEVVEARVGGTLWRCGGP